MTMGTWRSRQIVKKGKASRTPGRTKNANCQAEGIDRLMAKRNRSYKHPYYASWCEKKSG